MKRALQISSVWYLIMIIVIVVSGVVASALLTTDPRWMGWHISRLGEGGHVSSWLFNASMLLAGGLTLVMTRVLAMELDEVNRRRTHAKIRDKLATRLMSVMGLGMIGVALFPFDEFPVVHNCFGYGMFFALCTLMVLSPLVLPRFAERLYISAYAILIVSMGMMVTFHLTHLYTLLFVEIVSGTFITLWVLYLLYEINHELSRLVARREQQPQTIRGHSDYRQSNASDATSNYGKTNW